MKPFAAVFPVLLVLVCVACAGSEVRSSGPPAQAEPDKAEAAPPVRDQTPPVRDETADGAAADADPDGVAAEPSAEEEATASAASADAAHSADAPAADPATAAAASGAAGVPSPEVEALYQQCLARVEGREVDDECSADSDCVAAGCSTEICTTKAAAEGMMSTCENKPCFAVLDACGCNAGRCQWSLKDVVPALGPSLQLDPK